jgi:hypothetical protein
MLNTSKLALAAALVIASASAGFAAEGTRQIDRTPSYAPIYQPLHHVNRDGNVGFATRDQLFAPQPSLSEQQERYMVDHSTTNLDND